MRQVIQPEQPERAESGSVAVGKEVDAALPRNVVDASVRVMVAGWRSEQVGRSVLRQWLVGQRSRIAGFGDLATDQPGGDTIA